MRAGLLTDAIHILELQKTTSETGAEKREYVETHKIKAYRKKLSASVGDGVNASEEFISNTLVFQVRKYSFLNENTHIKYGIHFYKVILLDPQSDNSYLMTCSKINV
ncbi:MAG: head-tail adaptor protein [Dysgonamonadaceae bacterium]|jgi:head-tail adaptor|nr:head-tail adaptor protein [Dysgonamonadaceae bacterium]